MAYLKVQVGKVSKTVTLEDGSKLTIDNVPEGGQVDLIVTKRALVRDAAILSGDFVVTGGNFLPGDALTLTVSVRNSGNVALQNLKVGFYNGDLAASGVKIGEATAAGWLPAGAKASLAVNWVLPTATAAVQLFAVADPDGAVTESLEDNNKQSISVGGTDLVARFLSCTAATDGSARILAEVQNTGMPASPATALQVLKTGTTTVLKQVAVPVLQPGEIAQVALDLPAGTHPEGEVGFVLEVDAGAAVTDSNRFNNRTEFTSGLWRTPSIAVQPVAAQAVAVGGSTTFRVKAGGTGPFGYQWFKNGVAIAGAKAATLLLSNVQASDAGSYTVMVTNNGSGSAISNAGTLSVLAVGNAASHAVAGTGQNSTSTVTVSNTLAYSGTPSGLKWQVLLPTGWRFAADRATTGATKPSAGTTDLLEWTWAAAPAAPVTFTYTLDVPEDQNGTFELVAIATLSPGGAGAQILAQPDPLLLVLGTARHSADTDASGNLSLVELTRVIELYNTRNGTIRVGSYKVDGAGEDGFTVDPTRAGTAVLTRYHAADTNRDGSLGLVELTRVIELFNTRSGTTRTGAYHVQMGTEDGFAPGP